MRNNPGSIDRDPAPCRAPTTSSAVGVASVRLHRAVDQRVFDVDEWISRVRVRVARRHRDV